MAESVQIVLEALLVGVDSLGKHRGLQFLDVVDTLGTRHDLLTTHEEVIGVGESVVLGVGLGVEGSHGHGELVQNVEVGVVLVANDLAQLLLHRRREVILKSLLLRDINTGLLQQSHTIHVVQAQSLAVLGKFKVTGLGVRFLDGCDLLRVTLLELAKDEDKKVLSEVQNLVVVAAEGLFEIETSELRTSVSYKHMR